MRTYAYLTAHLNGSAHGFYLRFYQVQAQAPALLPTMEALVKLKYFLAGFHLVEARAIISKTNTDPTQLVLKSLDINLQWAV